MAKQWYKADVHMWSTEMNKLVLNEYPNLPAETKSAASQLPGIMPAVQVCYANDAKNQAKLRAIYQKVHSRMHVIDKDIANLCVGGLFVIVWGLIDKDDQPALTHFRDTLLDMDLTCVQGYTHRLFSSYVALERGQ